MPRIFELLAMRLRTRVGVEAQGAELFRDLADAVVGVDRCESAIDLGDQPVPSRTGRDGRLWVPGGAAQSGQHGRDAAEGVRG